MRQPQQPAALTDSNGGSRIMFRDTTHRPGALQRALLVGLGAALPAGAVAVFPSTVSAFKPYTHNHTAEKAYDDVVDDGEVTIDGKAYTVRP
jgi:hypothetical protein